MEFGHLFNKLACVGLRTDILRVLGFRPEHYMLYIFQH